MGWLIIGLLLALAGGLALFTHRSRRRPAADDTLVADLLGPRTGPGRPAPQAPPAPREHAEFPPVPAAHPVPAARPPADRAPQPAAARGPQAAADSSLPQPAAESGPQPAEGDWLDTQLAWITEWSAKMREQIAPSAAAAAVPPQAGPEPEAPPPPAGGGVSQLAGGGAPAPPSPPAPQRCAATTAKGSQCKLSARPGESTCAIHARGRARS